jgi:NTE family protein
MKKVGLALGGGGSLGLAHLGILKVFEENDIPIDCISGSSIGAVIGAHYSLYKDLNKLQEDAFSFIRENKFSLFNVETVIERKNRIRKIELFFEDIFEDKKFEDCKIPFACNALDLESGETVFLNKGALKKAILASMSIPGVFDPVFYWGNWLVDGGFLDPVPIDYLFTNNYDVLIGVDLHPHKFNEFSHAPTYFEVIQRSFRIFEHQMSINCTNNFQNKIIIKPQYNEIKDLFSLDTAKSYIEAGRLGALEKIDEIKKAIEK